VVDHKSDKKSSDRTNPYQAEKDKEVQQIRDSQWAKDQEKKHDR
jgi:hypothetical protein